MASHTHRQICPSNKVITRRVLIRMIGFAVVERWLNAVNLDTLADYHEFMQGQIIMTVASHQAQTNPNYQRTIAFGS